MLRGFKKSVIAGFCTVLIVSSIVYGAMTPKDVIRLKKLGFSDAEVTAEIQKTGEAISFTPKELEELKAAGAGEGLIQTLQGTAVKAMDVKAVVEMVKGGKSVDQILDAMAAAHTQFNLKPAEALELNRQGVPAAILLAIKGAPLGVPELQLLVEAKTPVSAYPKLAGMLGISKQDLKPADALALANAGVPDDVVGALKQGRAPSAPTSNIGDLVEYQHVDRLFTIRHPANWNLIREVQDGAVAYCFTPEVNKVHVKDTDVSVTISITVPEQDSPVVSKDPVATLKHFMPLFRANEPGLIPQGEIVAAKLGNLPAARLTCRGTVKARKSDMVFVGDLYVALDHGMFFMVVAGAPEAQYPAHVDAMHKILERSDFGFSAVSARGANQEPNDIVARYKQSVVSIIATYDGSRSSGTGFIIHKDGYIITNAHVAVDLENGGKMAKSYVAMFDSDTGLKPVPITYIGHRYHMGQIEKHYHGVDIAMFKLPPGTYTPFPLTALRDVQLGDPIVTMGFPHYFDFDQRKPSLFTTTGVVTRFNRMVDGRVQSIFMDAKITHGNSGGPCISRVTGGVIGLNTFGKNIMGANTREGQQNNDLVGYNGVVPIDEVMAEFPFVAELGLDPVTDKIDYYDAYELSLLYMGQGRHRASVEMARLAVQLQPQSADAHCLLGNALGTAALGTGPEICDFKAAVPDSVSAFKEALGCQADHTQSLLALSMLYLNSGDLVSASQYADKAVAAHPDDVGVQLQKALIGLALHQYPDVLAATGKAKALAHDLRAEPYILAGAAFYQQEKFEEGKAEFVRASEIHHTNLMARMGVVQYYELTKNFAAAVVELGRIDADLPDNAAVQVAMGGCYEQLKQYPQAIERYRKSKESSDYLNQPAPVEVYLGLGRIATDIDKNVDAAIPQYSNGLMQYGDTPVGAVLHLKLAEIFKGLNRNSIVFSHLRRAAVLQPANEDIKKLLASNDLPRPTLDDIVFMLQRAKYHPMLVADMVVNTPLGFQLEVKTKEDVQKLIDLGIPPEVFDAMIESNKKFPPGQGPPGPQPPQNPGAHPAEMLGLWSARLNNGTLVSVVLGGNGQYSFGTVTRFGAQSMDTGTWLIDAQGHFVATSVNDGKPVMSKVVVNGNILTWETGKFGVIRFLRVR